MRPQTSPSAHIRRTGAHRRDADSYLTGVFCHFRSLPINKLFLVPHQWRNLEALAAALGFQGEGSPSFEVHVAKNTSPFHILLSYWAAYFGRRICELWICCYERVFDRSEITSSCQPSPANTSSRCPPSMHRTTRLCPRTFYTSLSVSRRLFLISSWIFMTQTKRRS
jgi:hypothetical protein